MEVQKKIIPLCSKNKLSLFLTIKQDNRDNKDNLVSNRFILPMLETWNVWKNLEIFGKNLEIFGKKLEKFGKNLKKNR